MRLILLTLIGLSLTLSSQAESRAGLLFQDSYIIVSDSASNEVPVGFCKIVGTVHDGHEPGDSALVSNLSKSVFTYTDSHGYFEITVPVGDTSVFCFKSGSGEIVVWSYNFQSGHEVRIDFYLEKERQNYNVKKPVIYLYSDKDLNVNIQLDSRVSIDFTFPEYNDSWDVKVLEKSGISCKNKTYPYLFWDGSGDLNFEKDECNNSLKGFFIESKDAISFLEEKLTALGLNATEQTDFITFWGPQMIQSKYVLVQFQTEEWYSENISSLLIEPKPDSQRRIYMLMKNYEDIPNLHLQEQSLKSFERSGFTVVEWGGSVITNIKTL